LASIAFYGKNLRDASLYQCVNYTSALRNLCQTSSNHPILFRLAASPVA
jgi:hypothetical protein